MTSTSAEFGGEDVLALRTRLGITQSELADRLGVSSKSVGNWERGLPIRAASIHAMRAMRDALDEAVANDSLEERVVDLERRVDYLEGLVLRQRVDELAKRRGEKGLSEGSPSLGAVADSNTQADAEVEGRQGEP